MFKKLISFLLVFSFSLQVFADGCPQDVTILDKGNPAPCHGFLFSPKKEQELYLMNENYKLLTKEMKIKDDFIQKLEKDSQLNQDILDKEQKKTELWRLQAENSTKELISIKNTQGEKNLIMILSGVALTVLAGWSIGQAAK